MEMIRKSIVIVLASGLIFLSACGPNQGTEVTNTANPGASAKKNLLVEGEEYDLTLEVAEGWVYRLYDDQNLPGKEAFSVANSAAAASFNKSSKAYVTVFADRLEKLDKNPSLKSGSVVGKALTSSGADIIVAPVVATTLYYSSTFSSYESLESFISKKQAGPGDLQMESFTDEDGQVFESAFFFPDSKGPRGGVYMDLYIAAGQDVLWMRTELLGTDFDMNQSWDELGAMIDTIQITKRN